MKDKGMDCWLKLPDQIPALSALSCVALGNILNIYKPQFLHLKNGGDDGKSCACFLGLLHELNVSICYMLRIVPDMLRISYHDHQWQKRHFWALIQIFDYNSEITDPGIQQGKAGPSLTVNRGSGPRRHQEAMEHLRAVDNKEHLSLPVVLQVWPWARYINVMGNPSKSKSLGPKLDWLDQKLWVGSVIWVLTSPPGDADTHSSLRTTFFPQTGCLSLSLSG